LATSIKHSGFKRLIDRTPTLAILVDGQEVVAFTKDSAGSYARQQIGTNLSGKESSTYVVDGYGVSLATGYGASSVNRNSAFDVLADTGSTDLTGDTYIGAIRGRTIIGTTQTNASINGINGIVDVGNGIDFQGNLWGGQLVLDFYGDTTLGSGASCYGGGIGVGVWNEGTTTLGAGAVLAGIDLYEIGAVGAFGSGSINPAINIRGSWTNILHAGTSASPITCNTASTEFVSLYATGAATSGTAIGLRMTITGSGVGGSTKGLLIEANSTAGTTGVNNLYGLDVSAYIGDSGYQKSGGVMAGIYCWVGTGSSPTLNGSVYGLVIDDCCEAVPAQNHYPIFIVNNSSAQNATGPLIYVKTKCSHLFNLYSSSSPAWSTTGSLSTQTGWLLLSVEGVTRYVALYSG
jgi:hypothetical protein